MILEFDAQFDEIEKNKIWVYDVGLVNKCRDSVFCLVVLNSKSHCGYFNNIKFY